MQQKMYLCQIKINDEQKIVEVPENKEQPDKNHEVFFPCVDIIPGDKQRNILAPITINRILVNLSALTKSQYSTSEIQSVSVSQEDSLIFKKHTKVYSIEDWTCTYNINQFFYCYCKTYQPRQPILECSMTCYTRWLYHILNITPSEDRTDNKEYKF